MTLCKHVKTLTVNKRHYQFPNGELIVYAGTKKACLFLIDGLTYLTRVIDRRVAAKALKQLKNECKGITPDSAIEGEV